MTQTPTGLAADGTGQLDEAYQRLHATGPEFDGWLSNHGPMGAEAIVEHGDAHVVRFADTALDVFGRTGDPGALAAAHQAADLIGR